MYIFTCKSEAGKDCQFNPRHSHPENKHPRVVLKLRALRAETGLKNRFYCCELFEWNMRSEDLSE